MGNNLDLFMVVESAEEGTFHDGTSSSVDTTLGGD